MRRAKRFIIVMGALAGMFGFGAAAITGFLVAKNLGQELNPLTVSRLQSPLFFYGISLAWMVFVYAAWLMPRIPELTKIVLATAALAAAAIDFSLNVAVLAYPALEHLLSIVGIKISIVSVTWNYVALPIAVCLATFLGVLGFFTSEEETDSAQTIQKREPGTGRA